MARSSLAPQRALGGQTLRLLCGVALAAGSVAIALKVLRREPLPAASIPASAGPNPEGMVLIPGGRFQMGNDLSPFEACRPAHEVSIRPFFMDTHEVTVAEFGQFVDATGYITTAERSGRAWVFESTRKKWALTLGADWRRPLGTHSSTAGHENRPVIQVSWHDALAYARWAGKRLPTEAEWEYAARGGLYDADFPWGREEKPDGRYRANYWQGWFPDQDLGRDGFRGIAPVQSYPPNRFGLYDMGGNVWEWCGDWYADDYYRWSSAGNPQGPAQGSKRVQRGGSWLCADNAQGGLRVWMRGCEKPDACHNHVGFRCVRDARSAP